MDGSIIMAVNYLVALCMHCMRYVSETVVLPPHQVNALGYGIHTPSKTDSWLVALHGVYGITAWVHIKLCWNGHGKFNHWKLYRILGVLLELCWPIIYKAVDDTICNFQKHFITLYYILTRGHSV